MDQQELELRLEQMVDTHSVEVVLEALGRVCGDKAWHIAANWQDRGLASAWNKAATAIIRCAEGLVQRPGIRA